MQNDDKQETASLSARDVIDRFGGIRPAAKAIGVAFTTVQGWKERDHIPEHRWTELRTAAAKQGIDLSELNTTGEQAPEAEEKAEEKVAAASPATAETVEPTPSEDDMPDKSDKKDETVSADSTTDTSASDTSGDTSPWSDKPELKEEPEAPVSDDVTDPTPARKSRAGIWAILVLIVVAGAAVATWPQWNHLARPYLENYAPQLVEILYPDATAVAVTPAPAETPAQAPAAPAATSEPAVQAPTTGNNSNQDSDVAGTVQQAIAPVLAELRRANERIAELEQRPAATADGKAVDITPLVARITALETAPAASGADPELMGRLAAIEEAVANVRGADPETVSAISSNLATIAAKSEAMTQEIAQLQQALQDLRTARQSQASEGTSLALAVNQLAQAVNRRDGYQAALATVTALAGDNPAASAALADLQAFAEGGAPDMAALRSGFPVMASDVMKAIALADNADWMSSALGRVKSLVSIRRVGEDVTGDDPESLLAQAEIALNNGDLPEAGNLVGQLPPAGLEAASGWLEKARGRIAVMAAIDALQSQAIGALAQ